MYTTSRLANRRRQWIVGVVPCLPGFIAQVNGSVRVADGAVQLFYLNYLYGFLSSGLVYALLHRAFPARKLDGFVRDAMSARDLQRHYRDRWDSEPSDAPVWRGEACGEKGAEAEAEAATAAVSV